jgi:hypothetical protein
MHREGQVLLAQLLRFAAHSVVKASSHAAIAGSDLLR